MGRHRTTRVRSGIGVLALAAGAGCYDPPPVRVHTLAVESPRAEAARVRRLSAREYINVVADLLNETVDRARFPEETYDTGFDNGASSLVVEDEQAVVFEELAVDLADAALARHRDRLLGPCDATRDGAATCRAAFLDGFATRAYRRPLAVSERERLEAIMSAADFDRGLWTATLAVLQSPAFLYRAEIGDPTSDPRRRQLDPFETASALSFFLTGSLPDETLLAAARNGSLSSAADRRREATRLLSSPRGKDQLHALLDQWLATNMLGATTKTPTVYPSFDTALQSSMRRDIDRFYDYVIGETRSSLSDLFGATVAHVDPLLAAHYGVTIDVGPATQDPRRVDLGAARPGIMTRAGFLSVHASADSSGPVGRGVFVRAAILCARPSPPPPNVPPAPGLSGSHTTRERFEKHTRDPVCSSCHDAIDGVGFGFEQFDGIGRYREYENDRPIDASGNLIGSDGADGAYWGVPELSRKLLSSPRTSACYVRQVFRFAMGRGETPEDDDTLAALARAFDANHPITDVALDLVTSDAFVMREGE